MALFINTNINSLNAQRNLTSSQSDLATALQRLSSGLRINSAKDDAAGLAIATRFTTQINGLNQAVRNANDGVSLAQTSESALAEVTNNLQRIRELAVESANATNSASDRKAIDQEVQQRIAEITRIATQTTFNGLKVLDGSFGEATFQVGANVGDTISINLSTGIGASQIGQLNKATVTAGTAFPGGVTIGAGDLTINTVAVTAGSYADVDALVTAISAQGITGVTATNNGGKLQLASSSDITIGGTNPGAVPGLTAHTETATGGSAEVKASVEGSDLDFTNPIVLTAGDLTISNGTDTATVAAASYTDLASLEAAITSALTAAGITDITVGDSASGNGLKLTDSGTTDITVGGTTDTALAGLTAATTSYVAAIPDSATVTSSAVPSSSVTLAAGDLSFQVGANDAVSIAAGTYNSLDDLVSAINDANVEGLVASNDSGSLKLVSYKGDLTVGGNDPSLAGLTAGTTNRVVDTTTLDSVDVQTVAGSNDAIRRVDSALEAVSSLRSTLGAIQNRFESTIANLTAVSQNLSAARSRIQDADFAKETAALTRAQILQNAGISVLSQANASPQAVLKLLQ